MSTRAGDDDPGRPDADRIEGPLQRWERLTLFRAVAAVAAVSLLARLVLLDARPAHWDEARVAYWAQHYAETGSTGYYWEEHGPLVQLAARWLFEPLGVTDTAARLPVALVGGLLPLAALLYREHLRDSETVALALFLGGNSVLLYFSRFVRSDVLLAAFTFVSLGLLVRFSDTRRYRYLYGAGLFLALGFGSKENAVIYVLTWLGAAALVADQWLHSPASEQRGIDRLRSRLAAWRANVQVGPLVGHAVGAVSLALLVTIFIFADRGDGVRGRQPPLEGSPDSLSLGEALSQPLSLPGFGYRTLEGVYEGYADWFGKSSEKTVGEYIEFLTGFLDVLTSNATVLVLFAVLGVLLERYVRGESRWLVLFMAYCAVASLVGYPIGTDISGAWSWVTTHIVVPLAVPAAVGAAWLYRAGMAAEADRDTVTAALVGLVLLLAAVQVGFTAVDDVYRNPQSPSNELVQYAQPYDDLAPVVERLSATTGSAAEGEAVLYYGKDGDEYDSNRALVSRPGSTAYWDVRPTCSVWSNTQPLNWYFAVADATVTCERSPAALETAVSESPPPVIFTVPDDETVPTAALNASYDSESYYTRTIGKELVVYTRDAEN